MKEKILKIIISEIEDMEINHKVDKETKLFAKDGIFDSLGLVNLLVAIEQAIEDKFDCSITIADEKAMSQKNSPFKTVNSLADYVNKLVKI
jgi:D-alanine--poly(phosphoribitol) ligase subunit 2